MSVRPRVVSQIETRPSPYGGTDCGPCSTFASLYLVSGGGIDIGDRNERISVIDSIRSAGSMSEGSGGTSVEQNVAAFRAYGYTARLLRGVNVDTYFKDALQHGQAAYICVVYTAIDAYDGGRFSGERCYTGRHAMMMYGWETIGGTDYVSYLVDPLMDGRYSGGGDCSPAQPGYVAQGPIRIPWAYVRTAMEDYAGGGLGTGYLFDPGSPHRSWGADIDNGGAGGYGTPSDLVIQSTQTTFARVQDVASQTVHGLWQYGEYNTSLFRQASVQKRADSIVNGTTQSRRGAKDDQVSWNLATFDTRFQVGQKVSITSDVYGVNDVVPIRRYRLSFPEPTAPRFDLALSHEIDEPWDLFEFWFPRIAFPSFKTPVIDFHPWGGGGPPGLYRDCLPTDLFTGITQPTFNSTQYGPGTGEYLGPSSSGIDWLVGLIAPDDYITSTGTGVQAGCTEEVLIKAVPSASFPPDWSSPRSMTFTLLAAGDGLSAANAYSPPFSSGRGALILRFLMDTTTNNGPAVIIVPWGGDYYYSSSLGHDVFFGSQITWLGTILPEIPTGVTIPPEFWRLNTRYSITVAKTGPTEETATITDGISSYSIVNGNGDIDAPPDFLGMSMIHIRDGFNYGTRSSSPWIIGVNSISYSEYTSCTLNVFDDFERTVTGTPSIPLGTPSAPWHIDDWYVIAAASSPNTYGTNGHNAFLTMTSGYDQIYVGTTNPSADAFLIKARVSPFVSSGTNPSEFWFGHIADYAGAALEQFFLQVRFDTSSGGLVIYDPATSVAFPITSWSSATGWYNVVWQVDGSVMQAKVWGDGTPEPDWQLQMITTVQFSTSASLQFLMRTNAGHSMYTDYIDIEYLGKPFYGALVSSGSGETKVPPMLGDGTTTVFTLATTSDISAMPYVPGSTRVWVAGLFLRPGIDYTEQPDAGTITFTSPPAAGAKIEVTFMAWPVELNWNMP